MGNGCSREEEPHSYFGLPLSTLCEFEILRGVADSYRPNVPTLLQELFLVAKATPRIPSSREQTMAEVRAHVDSILKSAPSWKRGCRPFELFVSKHATSKSWVIQVITTLFASLPEAVIPAHVCAELDHILRSSLSQSQKVAAAERTLSKMSSLRLHAHEALVASAAMLSSGKFDSRSATVIADSWTRQHDSKLNELVLDALGVRLEQPTMSSGQALVPVAGIHEAGDSQKTGVSPPVQRAAPNGSVAPEKGVPSVGIYRDPSVASNVSEVTTQADRLPNTSVRSNQVGISHRHEDESKALHDTRISTEAVPTGAVPTGAVPTGAVPTGAAPTCATSEAVSAVLPAASRPTVAQQLLEAKRSFADDEFTPRETDAAQTTATIFCSQCATLRLEVDEIKQLLADMASALRQAHDETATLREQLQVTHHLVHGATVNKPFRDKIQTTVAEMMQSQLLTTEDIIKLRKDHRELAEQIKFANGDSDRLANEAFSARSVSLEVMTKLSDLERSLLTQQQRLSELDERCENSTRSQNGLKEAVRSLTADVAAVSHRST